MEIDDKTSEEGERAKWAVMDMMPYVITWHLELPSHLWQSATTNGSTIQHLSPGVANTGNFTIHHTLLLNYYGYRVTSLSKLNFCRAAYVHPVRAHAHTMRE